MVCPFSIFGMAFSCYTLALYLWSTLTRAQARPRAKAPPPSMADGKPARRRPCDFGGFIYGFITFFVASALLIASEPKLYAAH